MAASCLSLIELTGKTQRKSKTLSASGERQNILNNIAWIFTIVMNLIAFVIKEFVIIFWKKGFNFFQRKWRHNIIWTAFKFERSSRTFTLATGQNFTLTRWNNNATYTFTFNPVWPVSSCPETEIWSLKSSTWAGWIPERKRKIVTILLIYNSEFVN